MRLFVDWGKDTPNPRKIEPLLDVPEQVLGSVVERKFGNRKRLAYRRLIIQRKNMDSTSQDSLDGYGCF